VTATVDFPRRPTGIRRELFTAVGLAVALVIFRSIVFIAYEQLFDSDQAIVGLMAKHASELHAFPLFFYGQNYMLGVQAWIAVPFFWVAGPTVAMLRLPLLLINIVAASMVVLILVHAGVRPVLGSFAALPLAAGPPVAAGELLTTLGASIEPFLYVLLLWQLRRRPAAFGALLCAGTLHREFTILAAPALAIVLWSEHRRIAWRPVLRAAAAYVLVWLAVDVLKRALPAGPNASHGGESLVTEVVVIGQWLSLDLPRYLARTTDVFALGLPGLLGVRPHAFSTYGYETGFREGSWAGAAALGAAALVCAARLVWLRLVRRQPTANLGFPAYLALVGIQTAFVYGLNGGIIAGAPVLRYLLFVLWLPVALLAAFFIVERDRRWTAAVAALIAAWAAANLVDNARLLRSFVTNPPANEHRVLADYLTSNGITYGTATYWDCYLVDFLARERVILASSDISRIDEYQQIVDQHRSNAVAVERMPCDGGVHIASWCIVPSR
jgi:hypothetical protein